MALTISGSGGGIPTGTLKVETGSYSGTGTSGSSNAKSITFSGTPVLVIISTTSGSYRHAVFHTNILTPTYLAGGWTMENTATGADVNEYCMAKLDGKTLSWYYSNNSASYAINMMNASGKTYNWMAITY